MPDHVLVALDEMKRYMPYLGGFAYIRPTFASAGIDQLTQPPAQDEDLFTLADNAAPVVRGIVQRGWGYQSFGATTFPPARFAPYQRDQDGLRLVLAMSASGVEAITESGSLYSAILTPGGGASTPQVASSRGLAFFFDQVLGDLKKWSGVAEPSPPSVTPGSGGSWSAGTYYFAVSLLDRYGHESMASGTSSASVGASGSVTVTSPAAQTLVTEYRVYAGTAANALHLQATTAIGTNASISSYNASSAAPQAQDALITTSTGGEAPATAVGLEAPVSGAITLTVGRLYATAFHNSATGHTTDFSPLSASTGPLTAQNQPVIDIPQPTDPQFDTIYLLATADGGNVNPLYLLATLPVGANSYTDSTPDTILVAGNIYYQIASDGSQIGILDNAPPPNMSVVIKAGGRLFGIDGEFLYFSKSLAEITTSTGTVTSRYEECWPPDNQMDVSGDAEVARAVYWDGQIVYVGTNQNVWRITGSSPQNFSDPEIRFAGCGVMSQDTWQQVFIQDQPVGSMWLTPDRRVIISDMNNYRDVSGPVRPYLDSINTAAVEAAARASFVANDVFDLYVLAVPTGASTVNNTVLIFDLRHNTWWVRLPSDDISAMLGYVDASGSPHLLTSAADVIWDWQPSLTQDRVGGTPVTSEVNIQTAWLDCGDPQIRKAPWAMEVSTDDAGLTCDVAGVIQGATFSSPVILATGIALLTDPTGVTKFPLADYAASFRFLQFTFHSTANVQNVLRSYALIASGVDRE